MRKVKCWIIDIFLKYFYKRLTAKAVHALRARDRGRVALVVVVVVVEYLLFIRELDGGQRRRCGSRRRALRSVVVGLRAIRN